MASIVSTPAPEISLVPEIVTSPEDLISAFKRGVRHIQVLNHIDLTDLELPWPGVEAHLGHPSSRTHSISVRLNIAVLHRVYMCRVRSLTAMPANRNNPMLIVSRHNETMSNLRASILPELLHVCMVSIQFKTQFKANPLILETSNNRFPPMMHRMRSLFVQVFIFADYLNVSRKRNLASAV